MLQAAACSVWEPFNVDHETLIVDSAGDGELKSSEATVMLHTQVSNFVPLDITSHRVHSGTFLLTHQSSSAFLV